MSTTRTTVAPDLAALEHRAGYLESAAEQLEARHADHLRDAARALRDSWESGGKQGGKVRVRGARNVQQADATMRENDRRQGYQVNAGNENSWHYIDGQRRTLAQYAALYLDHLRGEPSALLVPVGRLVPDTPADLIAELDLAHDCATRAAIDRRIVAVLMADPDDWTIDPADRELAEQQAIAAIVQGADIVDAVAARIGAPPMPAPAEPPIPDGATVAVIYCRVSTREQGENGVGLDAQEAAAAAECERRGWHVARVVREVVSGDSSQRPLLAEACELAAHHRGVLVASKADRLTRGGVAALLALHERAAKEGWSVFALDVPEIDTTSPMGEFLLTVIAGINRLERRMIAQRTREGMAQAKVKGTKSGNPIGRPRAMPQVMVERLTSMRAEGLSYRAIADALNAEGTTGPRGGTWTDVTVAKAIKRWGTTAAG